MDYAVEINDITKRYGKITALGGVSFSVDKDEMFGVIGPDGAGKSTLYKILATLLQPDKGTAKICGLDTVKYYSEIRTKIGYMPERFSLYQDLTVSENLRFFASLFGVSVKDNYDLIAPIFSQLEKFPNRKAGALSGGMKQKLALSCALIHRPEILLLDEPTTGVDAVSRSEFWDMLSTLREKGITILVSTSYMDEATRCERIAMINRGKILDINTPTNLIAEIGENLYNAVADDMFRLLNRLRKMPEVIDCYTFGATLHVVVGKAFNPSKTVRQLEDEGLRNVKIYPAKGDIEDLFIKLTRDEEP
ncbi:MAG: ABC transporter ATP-binding protein [Muribaculaceae bacterium]|nr:ABC transporter ATP-binding protein [Muribaculaceae bacterium]